MRYLGLACAFGLVASVAQAQTSTATVLWDFNGVTTATVATYTQAVTLDGTAVTGTPTCAAAGANVTCSLPLGNVASGRHTVVVTASAGNVSASGSASFDTSAAPKPATNFRYQIIINVP